MAVRISKGFIKSSLIYTLAGTLPMASAIILLPFYVTHLSITLNGELSIYLAFSLLVQIFVTYSFDSSLYIHYHEFKKDQRKLSVFVSSAFIFMIILSMVAGVLLTLAGDLIFNLVLKKKGVSFYPFGLAAVGTGVFQGIFKVFSSLMQTRQRPEVYFWSNIVLFGLIAGLTIVGLQLYPGSLIGPVWGRFAATACLGLWALYRVFYEFGFSFDFQWLRSSFGFNNYTFIYQLELWVVNYFDRLLMTLYLSLADVGAYDFAWKCLLVLDFIFGGLYNSFYPKVIGLITDQKEKMSTPVINRYYHGLTAVIMLLVTGSILAVPVFGELGFLKREYVEALDYAPYVALVYLIRPMRYYFGMPYGVLKYTKPLPVIYLVVSAIKIGLMVLGIPRFGVWAVIGASMVSGLVEVTLLRVVVGHRFVFQYNVFKIVVAPLLLGFVMLILEVWAPWNKFLLHAFYFVFCAGMLVWFYRRELKTISFFGAVKT
jgi:O-antigen/teichoic acid export membrane protein